MIGVVELELDVFFPVPTGAIHVSHAKSLQEYAAKQDVVASQKWVFDCAVEVVIFKSRFGVQWDNLRFSPFWQA